MYTWWFVMLAVLAVPVADPGPEAVEDVIVVDTEVVQEDGGTAEPMCCGPNEPAPPRPK